jgi:hypothetical protein
MVQVGFKADPQLPGVVPLLQDLGETPDQTEILVYATKAFMTGFPFATAQDVPADRVKALRAAFDATMKDKVFLDEAARMRVEVAPTSGVELQKLITDIVDVSPALREKVRAAITPPGAYYGRLERADKKKSKKK